MMIWSLPPPPSRPLTRRHSTHSSLQVLPTWGWGFCFLETLTSTYMLKRPAKLGGHRHRRWPSACEPSCPVETRVEVRQTGRRSTPESPLGPKTARKLPLHWHTTRPPSNLSSSPSTLVLPSCLPIYSPWLASGLHWACGPIALALDHTCWLKPMPLFILVEEPEKLGLKALL